MEPEKEADRASSYLTNGITDFIGGCAAALVNSFDTSCLYRAFCRPTYTYITVLRVLSPLVGSDRSIKYQGQELSKVRYIPGSLKGGAKIVPCSCVHGVYGTDQSTPEFYHKAQVVPRAGIQRHALSNRRKQNQALRVSIYKHIHPALWHQCSIINAVQFRTATWINAALSLSLSLSLSQPVCCLATHCHTPLSPWSLNINNYTLSGVKCWPIKM